MILWLAVPMAAGVVPSLTRHGCHQLAAPASVFGTATRIWAAAAGAAAAAASVLGTVRAGSAWWLPGLLVWAAVLASCAVCDAVTQRIPTRLATFGGVAAAALLTGASAITHEWSPAITAALCSVAAGSILAVCWRFAGLGFGDVRIGILGGLGLGHTAYSTIALAVVVFCVICGASAAAAYLRTRDPGALFPVGPALAAAFLVAAAG